MPDIWMFLIAATILTFAPGPDNLYVLTRGITQGKRAALAAAAGFATGCLWHTTLAAVGVATLIQQSAIAFTLIKLSGAAYLCYIGYKTLRGKSQITIAASGDTLALWPIFRQSVIANMLNPKVTLFFIAFLPQFVNKSAGHIAAQMALLGILFMCQTIMIFGFIGISAGAIGNWLQKSPRIANKLDLLAGWTFIGLGVRVALQSQK